MKELYQERLQVDSQTTILLAQLAGKKKKSAQTGGVFGLIRMNGENVIAYRTPPVVFNVLTDLVNKPGARKKEDVAAHVISASGRRFINVLTETRRALDTVGGLEITSIQEANGSRRVTEYMLKMDPTKKPSYLSTAEDIMTNKLGLTAVRYANSKVEDGVLLARKDGKILAQHLPTTQYGLTRLLIDAQNKGIPLTFKAIEEAAYAPYDLEGQPVSRKRISEDMSTLRSTLDSFGYYIATINDPTSLGVRRGATRVLGYQLVQKNAR